MPLSRNRFPKIARHAAFGHINDYDLENQSRVRDGSIRRRLTTVLTGTGSSEPLLLNTRCNVRSVATTIRPLSDLKRSAHCRSTRRWTLNGYLALIRSTSLTRFCFIDRLTHYLSANFRFASHRVMALRQFLSVDAATGTGTR